MEPTQRESRMLALALPYASYRDLRPELGVRWEAPSELRAPATQPSLHRTLRVFEPALRSTDPLPRSQALLRSQAFIAPAVLTGQRHRREVALAASAASSRNGFHRQA
jgi:hypothetical protein